MKHFVGFFILVASFFIVTPLFAAYGNAPTFAASTTNPPGCSNKAPITVWPFWAKAVDTNAINLTWGAVADTSSWTVAYGVSPGTYIYGVSNFGNNSSRSFTINSLPAGTYYVVIRANNGCMPGPFSNEWKVAVGGGGSGTTFFEEVIPTPTTFQTTTLSGNRVTPTVRPTARVTPKTIGTPVTGQKLSWWQQILHFFTGK